MLTARQRISHPRLDTRLSGTFPFTRSNNAPLYLSCLLHNYVPGRSLRSSQSNLLSVPSYKLNFGASGFRVAAPTVWNSLPADIRACTFYGSFTRQLKTFYFNNAF